MPPPNNGSRNGKADGGKSKKNDKALVDSFRDVCPPHRLKDLEELVKSLKGDEEKIGKTLTEWWEPTSNPEEEEWADVNKKAGKKTRPPIASGRGGRGRGPGRGGRGRGADGGRAGRGSTKRGPTTSKDAPDAKPKSDAEDVEGDLGPGIPTNVRVPRGAWAKKDETGSATEPVAAESAAPEPAASESAAPLGPSEPVAPAPEPIIRAPVVTEKAPVPPAPVPAPPRIRTAGGNVWATKGSAHLIQAEKPKPKPPAPIQRKSAPRSHSSPDKPPHAPAAPALETGAPWTAAVSDPMVPPPSPVVPVETPAPPAAAPVPPSPVGTNPIGSSLTEYVPPQIPMPEPSAATQPIVVPTNPPAPPAAASKSREPARGLNMGHWDSGDNGDNLDFDFGTFGESDVAATMDSVTANGTTAVSTKSTQNASAPVTSAPPAPPAAAPSPARPPPGLSIGGGMRPIPADAVLVHELENKLEEASLKAASEKNATSATPTTQATVDTVTSAPVAPAHTVIPTPTIHQPSVYSPYGGMGMYNPAAPFVGVPGLPKPAAGLAPPQQPQQQHTLYGGATPVPTGSNPPSAPSSGGAPGLTVAGNTTTDSTPAPGMPPGMPGMSPYANPALYYGQQPYMPQHQGQLGYNYGYGAQFGGAVQGGFGYPQAMGQSGGYGHQPHYDDHTSGQPGGGYPKSAGGGYRRNNNQYQNQYNPQQYGGPPYGMGYHGDHFSQRGGYGGMQDHYMQQPQQQQQPQGGGFHDDEQKGGRKGGRYQQFQPNAGHLGHHQHQPHQHQPQPPPQQPQPQQPQQPPFGLPQGTESAPGWSPNQSAAGAWGGGAPSWQGK